MIAREKLESSVLFTLLITMPIVGDIKDKKADAKELEI